jgi:dihydrofolate reductase
MSSERESDHVLVIAAVAKNGAIGKGNQLPWRSKEDLQIFKRMTTGKIVVMGRKTAESLASFTA